MLAGHLAVGLAATRVEPRVPLPAAVGAAFALDLAWPLLLLADVEVVRVHPHDTAFTALAFDWYPWTHSLAAVAVWSVGAGAVAAWRLGARGGVVVGTLVMSHWWLDALTHRPDLPLWPGGPLVGAGLWNSVPATIAVEGALFAAGVAIHALARRARDATGRWAFVGPVALIGLLWIMQPWSPPPPSAGAVAWGALTLWLLLPWCAWIARHRGPARGA
jgi:hypothetical protein